MLPIYCVDAYILHMYHLRAYEYVDLNWEVMKGHAIAFRRQQV